MNNKGAINGKKTIVMVGACERISEDGNMDMEFGQRSGRYKTARLMIWMTNDL